MQRGSEDTAALIGVAQIGEGYLLRTDGVAVGLAELTPPDLRLLDDRACSALLARYAAILQASQERFLLYTYAVPPGIRPVVQRMRAAAAAAPDVTGYLVLETLGLAVEQMAQAAAQNPMVRWILAVPTEEPDLTMPGLWSDLAPAAPPPRPQAGAGARDAVQRVQRLLGALSTLEIEPPPRLLSAGDIRDLVRLGFDPIGVHAGVAALPASSPSLLDVSGEGPSSGDLSLPDQPRPDRPAGAGAPAGGAGPPGGDGAPGRPSLPVRQTGPAAAPADPPRASPPSPAASGARPPWYAGSKEEV